MLDLSRSESYILFWTEGVTNFSELPSLFQDFVMHENIVLCLNHSKIYVSREVKTT
jgi:hypothetical protein